VSCPARAVVWGLLLEALVAALVWVGAVLWGRMGA
jgi:hypothetical protein